MTSGVFFPIDWSFIILIIIIVFKLIPAFYYWKISWFVWIWLTAWQEVWLMIWMGFNNNHSAKARLLQLNCDFCVCMVAHLFYTYFIFRRRTKSHRKALSARPHFFFFMHVSRTVSDKEVTICLSHLPRNTAMQTMTHFVSVSQKGAKKKKETKQLSASSLNTLVIRLPGI